MTITINGTTGITTPTYNGSTSAEYLVPVTAFKNRIINGAMMIDQRNAGAAVTANNDFPVDRFKINNTTDGAYSAQQSTTAPTGFVNSLKITTTTADASLTTTQRLRVQYAIEGNNVSDFALGTASAKTFTLSFWVRSSLTGTFGGSVQNNDADRSYVFTYTISAADTWEQKTVTIAGDTTGTWVTNTSIGLRINFGLGIGPDYSGTAGSWTATNNMSATSAVSVIGTLNATFYITGVQLEVGSTATSFDYRPYGTELALCQRYFQMLGTGNQKEIGFGAYWGTTEFDIYPTFKVSMRTGPTVYQTTGTNYFAIEKSGGNDTFDNFDAIARANENGCLLYASTNVSGTAGFAAAVLTNSASAYIGFSAEL